MFGAACLALLVVPGPAVLYIVTRSIDQGRAAGLASVAGIHVGTLVHVVGAALGLSAILATSATAFAVVKYAGAAYLIILGFRKLLEGDRFDEAHGVEPRRLATVFRQGILVNVLNPKTALFFLAFLPQFVHPERGNAAVQTIALGLLFVLLGLMSDSLYALIASSAGRRLRGNRRFAAVQRYTSGGVYLSLGVVAALSGARAKA